MQMKKKIKIKHKIRTFSDFGGTSLRIFVLLCSLCCLPMAAQNEMQINGFANAPSIMNPAAAGSTGSIKALASFRAQWVGFENAPQTTVLGIDSEVKFLRNFHGIGASVVHDKTGTFTNMLIDVNYSYHIELDKGLLGLGMRAGIVNTAFTTSDLHATVNGLENDYHQDNDEALQGSDDSASSLDVGLGAYFQSKKSVLSFSMLHVNAPKLEMKSGSLVKYKPVATLFASRQFASSNDWKADATLNAKTDFASLQIEACVAATIKEKVWFATGYRLQDAVIFQVGANLSNGLCVGYSYDLCVSKLHKHNTGSHEIIATYSFDSNVEKRKKRYKSVRIL